MNANNNEIGCNNHSREVNPKSTEESGTHPSTKTRILLDGKEETYLAVEGKEGHISAHWTRPHLPFLPDNRRTAGQ